MENQTIKQTTMDNGKKIKGYKGFNPDLTCRDFKYEVGKEYQTDEAKTCKAGFHFCENPFDVWEYYPLCDEKGQLNRFCEVEGSGDIDNSDKNKTACTHIKISAEIGIKGIIRASVKYILNSVKKKQGNYAHSVTQGDRAHSVTQGDRAHSVTQGYGAYSATMGYGAHSATQGYGAHSVTQGYGAYSATMGYGAHSATQGSCAHSSTQGDRAHSATQGYGAHSVTQGDRAHSVTQGDRAHSVTQGDCAHSVTQGNYAHSVTQGDCAHSVTQGYGAHSVTQGYGANSTVKGQEAIAAALGKEGMAKGALGCWIVIAEYDEFNGIFFPIKCVKAFKVDGEKIKADTFYKLENGEAVEVKE